MTSSLREKLAELEHDQWIAWSKNIAETESITPARFARWRDLWKPYSELNEAQKDQDRVWSDLVIKIFIEKIDELYLPVGDAPSDNAVPSDHRAFGGNSRLDALKTHLGF